MEKWNRFFGPGWARTLNDFLSTEDFNKIGGELKRLRGEGKEIAPNNMDLFRAFRECPRERLHTVILGSVPYSGVLDNGKYVADGLAFSAKYSIICPVQLCKILRAVDEEIYDGRGWGLESTYDLTNWANQGVLLLNCSLTVQVGDSMNAHVKLWRPFIEHVIKKINEEGDCIGFILMGEWAQAYRKYLTNESFAIYECEHPMEASYRGGKWNSRGVFAALQAYHKSFNNIRIFW